MATVAQLGARALRKLGIAIVADAARPGAALPATLDDVAARVLRELGIPVAENARPALLGTVGLSELGARTLRTFGVNPIAGTAAPGSTVSREQIAIRALRAVGVNPADFQGGSTNDTFVYSQIATAALLKLAVVGADELPSAQDQAYAEARVRAVHDMLIALDYVTWNAAQIPGSVAEAYIALTANLLAPSFGKPSSPEIAAAAQEMIRQQALAGPAQVRALDRVQTVHDSLVAQGFADWLVTAIPTSVAEGYVTLTAALLAPVHGKQAEPAASAAATEQIRRVALSGPRGEALAEAALRSVHDDAVSEGVVSWPINAVPVGNAEEYVRMARARMAPVFGQQVPETEYADAIENLRRQARIAGAMQRARDRVWAVHEELNAMGLVTWTANTIPIAMADAYATLATQAMASDGGAGPANATNSENAYQRIRQIAMGGPAGQALAEQKIRAVHASLEARGRARWTLMSVPVWAEEPLVFMAATLLAPECGVKADPNWWQAAEADLMKIISLPSNREPVRVAYF